MNERNRTAHRHLHGCIHTNRNNTCIKNDIDIEGFVHVHIDHGKLGLFRFLDHR